MIAKLKIGPARPKDSPYPIDGSKQNGPQAFDSNFGVRYSAQLSKEASWP